MSFMVLPLQGMIDTHSRHGRQTCKTHQWETFGNSKYPIVLCKVCGAKKEEAS